MRTLHSLFRNFTREEVGLTVAFGPGRGGEPSGALNLFRCIGVVFHEVELLDYGGFVLEAMFYYVCRAQQILILG